MNRRLFFMSLFLLALLWFSTRNGEESGDKTAVPVEGGVASGGVVRVIRNVVIKPALPDVRSTLRVEVEASPPSFETSDYRYRWFVNKKEVSQGVILPLKGFQQNDLVSVEVTLVNADDGTSPPPATDTVKIGNNPPVVKEIRLSPIPVFAGEAIRAEVISEDIDGDFVNLTYAWQVNRQPVPSNDRDTLEGDHVRSTDQIIVFVTPSDSFSKGVQQVSPLMTVTNRSPEIVSFSPRQDEGKIYRYQVVAKDPDGDQLHYLLVEGPPGMKIDPASGLVDWEIVPFSKAQSHVRVEANDAKGGRVMQTFTIQ